MSTALPPVTPAAASEAMSDLPPRLRKRLPAAAEKAKTWPVTRDARTVTITVDEETSIHLALTPHGTVNSASDVTCSCLLAPACLHRAAILAAAPLAEEGTPEAEPEPEPESESEAQADASAREPTAQRELPPEENPLPPLGKPEEAHSAATALWKAGVAALCEGATTASLPRTQLLHAAQAARLAGLPRPAASATRVARRLTEAGAADSSFRLAELTEDLTALLTESRTIREATRPTPSPSETSPETHAESAPETAAETAVRTANARAAEARAAHARAAAGTSRRAYEPANSLRLYGLFTEPVVTASGYAGATTYLVTPDGDLRSLAIVLPGSPDQARKLAGFQIPGGAALTMSELGRARGLITTGASLEESGRIGSGGAKFRSVAASGATWYEDPLDALWRRRANAQVRAVLAHHATPPDRRPTGGGLLFLEGTVVQGPTASRKDGPALALDEGGPLVVLHAPDERPELGYVDNLRLLAAHPGAHVRVIGRLTPDRPAGVTALALATESSEPYHLGLDRLPPNALSTAEAVPTAPTGAVSGVLDADPLPLPPVEWDLLNRTVARTVAGGRSLAAAAVDPALPTRLRSAGLVTGAACAQALADATRARRSDVLGAMLPADPDAFATAWLATALYVAASARDFTATAWARTASITP